MTRYLFALWEGAGAVPPVLSVAGALRRRGHDVRVLADPVLRPEVEAAGAEHVDWTRTPHRVDRSEASELFRDWEARTPLGALARVRDRLMFGRAADVAADVRAELDRRPADVVVAETALPGAILAAEGAGLPSAMVFTTVYPLPLPGRPPFGPGLAPMGGPVGRARDGVLEALSRAGWNRGLAPLNEARREHGLPPLANAMDQYQRADRVLALTTAAFDTGDAPLPKGHVHTGPRLDDPSWVAGWTPPPGDDPLVLVGLSTSRQGQVPLLRRIASALGAMPVRAVLTTGLGVDPPDVPAPANVQVVRSAPHSQVLPHAAAVVTHAGHGTVIKALAEGVPLVCLPMGRDQLEVAARVRTAGAGVVLPPRAKEPRIAAAIGTVLADPSYREAAGRMRQAIRADLAEDRAVAELEALARSRQRASRPAAMSTAACS